jgi:hypothetical protein
MLAAINVPQSVWTMLALLPDRWFQARATRTLWTDFTGDDIKEPRSEWRAYCDHVERRNRAAHGSVASAPTSGITLTREDAEPSLRAVLDLQNRIMRVTTEQVREMMPDGKID